MKKPHTLTIRAPHSQWSSSFCLNLCISLLSLLLAACGNPGSDENAQVGVSQTNTPGSTAVTTTGEREQRVPSIAIPTPDDMQINLPLEETSLRVESDIAVVDVLQVQPRAEAAQASTGAAISALQQVVTSSADHYARRRDASERELYHSGPYVDRENYLDIIENSITRVSDEPLSTFSIDVDTAAYANLRRMLTREGRLPPHDAVRLEEMINYFDYSYSAPDDLESPIAVHTESMVTPWNPDTHLLMVGMKGFELDVSERPNANLVFLLDVSGSMQSADKLGLVKRSLQLLVNQMQEDDRIAIVVYAGAAGTVLDSTPGSEKSKVINALDSLTAGGSTNGAAGIRLAYQIAEENKIDGGINRVIIASDGDLNVGVTSIDELKEMITRKRENGIALTTLGYGSGNYNYSLMEQLADTGNGNAAYIDSLTEAQKVLVEEMQSTLLTIAKDVKIQIEFNPSVVAEYRLIGYENRLLADEDFRNDKVDAGEVGAGHTVTALYEISLKGSQGTRIPDRRYSQVTEPESDLNDELAYVSVRYKMPEQTRSTEFGQAIEGGDLGDDIGAGSENIRFAAAVAGFGQLLRGGKHTSDWDYDDLLQLARQSRGADDHGYRSEMVKLVELAKVL